MSAPKRPAGSKSGGSSPRDAESDAKNVINNGTKKGKDKKQKHSTKKGGSGHKHTNTNSGASEGGEGGGADGKREKRMSRERKKAADSVVSTSPTTPAHNGSNGGKKKGSYKSSLSAGSLPEHNGGSPKGSSRREKERAAAAAEARAKESLQQARPLQASSTRHSNTKASHSAVRELLTKEPPAELSKLMEPKVSIYDWVDLPDKLLVKPVTSVGRFVQISGPEAGGFDAEEVIGGYAAGAAINNYPLMQRDPDRAPVHLGHPIADYFLARLYGNRSLIALGDGCGWGRPAAEASCIAANTFLSYLTSKMKEIISVRDAGRLILRAFSEAHNKILGSYDDIWEAGTTTMLAGLILEVDISASEPTKDNASADASKSSSKDKGKERATAQGTDETNSADASPYRWVFVCASVGDSKALHYSGRTKEVTDITHGNRSDLRGATDPGGRLGAMVGGGDPDLRNLFIHFVPCQEGDYIILLSDGVHDNLDPVTCGVSTADAGLDATLYPKWDNIPDQILLEAKRDYLKRQVEQRIAASTPVPVGQVVMPNHATGPALRRGTVSVREPEERDPSSSDESEKGVEKDFHPTLTTTSTSESSASPDPLNMANELVDLARVMCHNSLEWMHKTPDVPLPNDYARFPGKMDHATSLVLHVGQHDFRSMHV